MKKFFFLVNNKLMLTLIVPGLFVLGIIFFIKESGIIMKTEAQSCGVNDVFNVNGNLGVSGTITATLGCSSTTTVSYGCHGNGTEECPAGYYIKEVGFGTCLLDTGNITRLICCRP